MKPTIFILISFFLVCAVVLALAANELLKTQDTHIDNSQNPVPDENQNASITGIDDVFADDQDIEPPVMDAS